MKKTVAISVGALLLLSSCGTYTGAGAYTGGTFGSMIGSAIGGIAGGPRGSDIGMLIGMAGGAAVGAAVGAAADDAQQRQYEEHRMSVERRRSSMEQRDREGYGYSHDDYGRSGSSHDRSVGGYDRSGSGYDRSDVAGGHPDSGYDGSASGDDRLYGFGENFGSTVTPAAVAVEIRNPRVVDASRDGVLSRGEEVRVVFEVYNTSKDTAYRVQPFVTEATGNRHIRVSENVLVERILPGEGIRYTAMVKADNRLRDGSAVIRVGVMQADREVASQTREFTLLTRR